MQSMPPMYGLRGSGMTTEPSSFWKFSSMATINLGTAQAVALRVCTNSVGTLRSLLAGLLSSKWMEGLHTI